jgi:lysophospholipase L1-like esterase
MSRHVQWSVRAENPTFRGGSQRRLRRVGSCLVAAATILLAPTLTRATPARATTVRLHWITTWAASAQPAAMDDPVAVPAFPAHRIADQSIRMIARITSPGGRIRIRLSNRYGVRPLHLGPISLGRRAAGPALVNGSNRAVRFAGRSDIVLAPGLDVVSDPITFAADSGEELSVSMHVVGATTSVSWHRFANSVSYVSAAGSGDKTNDVTGTSYDAAGVSWLWLAGVETESPYQGTVVALGDSITDGWEVAPDQPETWPEVLARRMTALPAIRRHAVVNAGIAGNEVRGPFNCGLCGAPAVLRLDHDALNLSGVADLIVFEGTNDLSVGASAADLINGLANIARRAHRHGVRVLGATITPRGYANLYWTAAMETARETVNHWIRTSGVFDSVLDFDLTLRDPIFSHQMAPSYDSGDSVHPNATGLAALAESIDLNLFA